MKIGIGIDTGGTYTDAVAYDFETESLLAKGKALTTRENLAVGIGNALDILPQELVRSAKLIALSTTLATNACVENKGCRAKLLIFGLTDELIVRYKAEEKYGFKRENVRCVETNSSADGLRYDEPDWDAVMSGLAEWLSDADAMSIAELYSMSNGAPNEKHAKMLLSERFGIDCVGASELTGDVDVLARGATALLNARLFPIGREFIEAALSDFKKRGCTAPVMVVRSDGSLMSAELTRSRPVETILSGPAASVLAGKTFASDRDYLIIDMGGTTTDVSVVSGGRPAMVDDGIRIGGWRTHVKGVFIDTFALGGDSTIRVRGDSPRLNPRRAMPICVAAQRWNTVKPMLTELLSRRHINQFPLHEFFYLVNEPADPRRYDADELRLIAALRGGPCMLGKLAENAGVDLYHLDSERLESEGVVMRCGLTPTDFMHIAGDFTVYDREAAELAARFMLINLERPDTPAELAALTREVYELAEGYLYENLVRILLAKQFPKQYGDGVDAQTLALIRDAWERRGSAEPSLFMQRFHTDAALVGVGAPTHVFLPEVARALGTQCVLPEHAEVANAIGALKAHILAIARIDITQRLSSSGAIFYIAHLPSGSVSFDRIDDAIAAAMVEAEQKAVAEATARGAAGKLEIHTYSSRSATTSSWGSDVRLGGSVISEVTARF